LNTTEVQSLRGNPNARRRLRDLKEGAPYGGYKIATDGYKLWWVKKKKNYGGSLMTPYEGWVNDGCWGRVSVTPNLYRLVLTFSVGFLRTVTVAVREGRSDSRLS
jgi:hypothetical protein